MKGRVEEECGEGGKAAESPGEGEKAISRGDAQEKKNEESRTTQSISEYVVNDWDPSAVKQAVGLKGKVSNLGLVPTLNDPIMVQARH